MISSRKLRLFALMALAALVALAIVAFASARSGSAQSSTASSAAVPKFTKAQIAAGKKVFLTAGCKGCHTLKAAKSHGTVGPNLDKLKPGYATIMATVTNGFNGPGTAMPAFGGYLSKAKIKDVAAFVYTSTHKTAKKKK
ncbi:MAG TPA: c-type cytochrome [Gaiellaceae bacterium]|jgi:mono/diheme cytochrome c family protein|nr:c-type cytochrome [Gaiellaceae bacterium]